MRASLIVVALVAAVLFGVGHLPTNPNPAAAPEATTQEVPPGTPWIVVGVDVEAGTALCVPSTGKKGEGPSKRVPVEDAEHLAAQLNAWTMGQFSDPPPCPAEPS